MNNLMQLKYAVEVEKTGSISRAAENLFMNQPNLSKAIRDLERELGITIFERTAKGVIPTEKGREFLGYAKNIISQMEEIESLYKPAADSKVQFNICAPRASYVSFAFTEFVKALGDEAEIGINYRETNSMLAIKNVSEGANNLAVVRYREEHEPYFLNALSESRLKYEPIWTFSYLALMSREHPLAGEAAVNDEMLCDYTEIVHGDLSVPSLPAAEARRLAKESERRRTIAIYERGSQFELLSRVPTTYIWVSPMPQEVLDRFGLVVKPCHDAQNRFKDILIYRTGYRFTREDRLFIEKLREAVRMVGEDQD